LSRSSLAPDESALDRSLDRDRARLQRSIEPLSARYRRATASPARSAKASDDPLEGFEGDQQADVNRRGQGAQSEARDDRGQSASGDLDRQEIHQPRPAIPRL